MNERTNERNLVGSDAPGDAGRWGSHSSFGVDLTSGRSDELLTLEFRDDFTKRLDDEQRSVRVVDLWRCYSRVPVDRRAMLTHL